MPEREEESDGERTLTLRHELPRGVVDGGDVVGVERVTHAQRVGRDRYSDAEQLEVLRDDWDDEVSPARDGQGEDGACHAGNLAPFAGIEPLANRRQSRRD